MRRFASSLVAVMTVGGVVGLALALGACSGEDRATSDSPAERRVPASPQARVAFGDDVPRTARVNVSTSGRQANAPTRGAVLSSNGRFVAFVSWATTLVPRDRNRTSDIFVRDLRTSRTTRLSISSAGAECNGESLKPSISADGRTVAFPSVATNLVAAHRNRLQDIFVRDRDSGTTRCVTPGANGTSLAALVSENGRVVVFSSEASNLVPGDRNGALDVFVAELAGRARVERVSVGAYGEASGRSEASSVSARGRVVAFRSYATDLVRGDSNGIPDVFVRDRRRGVTERVNVSSRGEEANDATFRGMLSADGRFVGFRSRATNLVPGDTNDALDVFVHDRVTGRTTRISVSSSAAQARATGFDEHARHDLFMSRPFLSADGRFAAFTSRASNLVRGDRNGDPDVFVHDLETGRTIRVSVRADGREANGGSFVSGISADGRIVAFQSFATNLAPGDTNGHRDVFVRWLPPYAHR